MPALSPTMTQGNIGAWKKSPGERIEAGDILCEIETDKAQMDFEASEDGYLVKVIREEGSREVAVGEPLAVVTEEEADVEKLSGLSVEELVGSGEQATASKETAKEPKKEEESPAPKSNNTPAEPKGEHSRRAGATPQQESRPPRRPEPWHVTSAWTWPRSRALGPVTGSQRRMSRHTVQRRARRGPPPRHPQSQPPPLPKQGSNRGRTLQSTSMRKTIAQRLVQSTQNIPHFYLTMSINMERIVRAREAINAKAPKEEGKRIGKAEEGPVAKLSVNDFIIKASAMALKRVPEVNSSWIDENTLRRHSNADISVAVATPAGLVTIIKGRTSWGCGRSPGGSGNWLNAQSRASSSRKSIKGAPLASATWACTAWTNSRRSSTRPRPASWPSGPSPRTPSR